MRSLAGWIERHAETRASHPAIVFEGRTYTYAELAGRIAELSAWLESGLGLEPGARVAWLGYNSPDQFALLFACAHAGLVLVPLNWRLASGELETIAADAGIAALLADESCTDLAARMKTDCLRASLPPAEGGARLEGRDVDPRAPVLLVYTSGTTGAPKGASLSQIALQFNALNAIHMHTMSCADRVLTVLPTFHVGGLNIQSLPALYCGASVALEPRFDPTRTLALINDWRPSLMVLVPATIDALLQHPRWDATNLGSLRAVTTGSTDVPRRQIEAIHARGVPVIQVYGSTETGPLAIYQRIDEAFDSVGSIGRAGLHTEIRLVDNEGRDVSGTEAGEILVRGPHIASGYWDQGMGAPRPFPDGWFHSGDVAVRDEHGLYWFRDRIKHVIIAGGENIYPAELERILDASTDVLEAAVVGRADERWGEVPVAIVVPCDTELSEKRVLDLFNDTVARYKRPREVVFVDALPRNAMGKVELARVREIISG